MPARFHWVRLRASCHGTEDPAKVRAALAFVAGVPADELELETTELDSHHGGHVLILETMAPKSRVAREVLERVTQVPGAESALVETLESRTDDDGVFYLRVDKQAACLGRLELTQGEDCVQCRFKVESYPAGRDSALVALRDHFGVTESPVA
jgi:RNA binding exosome subunit